MRQASGEVTEARNRTWHGSGSRRSLGAAGTGRGLPMAGYAGDVGRVCRGSHHAFARSLARSFVSILGSLVADEAEHAAGDVGDDELVG